MCELSLQEVADCLKAPVRMVGESGAVFGVSLKLVQKQERIEVPELLNRNYDDFLEEIKQFCLSSNASSNPGSSPF